MCFTRPTAMVVICWLPLSCSRYPCDLLLVLPMVNVVCPCVRALLLVVIGDFAHRESVVPVCTSLSCLTQHHGPALPTSLDF